MNWIVAAADFFDRNLILQRNRWQFECYKFQFNLLEFHMNFSQMSHLN